MEYATKPTKTTNHIMQNVEFTVNVVNQMCIGFVTIYMSWRCISLGLVGTALHAWLVTIGFSLLLAEGIMCHYSGSVLAFNYKRSTKTTMHWVLQALGGACGVAGVLVKIIPQFELDNTHSQLGFSAFILCLCSMLSGMSALFSMRIKRFLNPLLNKGFHNLLGMSTFVVAMVTQIYGYRTSLFISNNDGSIQIMIQCITLTILLLTSIGPLKALYSKFRT